MSRLNNLWKEFFYENTEYLNFVPQNHLNSKFWDKNDNLKPKIDKKLKKIANDFVKNLDFDVEIKDIIITGSLANYNWSSFSDLDLHILVDFSKINQNTTLVKNFFDQLRLNWNNKHKIMFHGHEVEIYVQDIYEKHVSTGVYSLKYGWVEKPERKKVTIGKDEVNKKFKMLSSAIDAAEGLYKEENFEEAHSSAKEIKKKIRNFRKCGLERAGVYSSENLAFKALRRSGYLEKLSNLAVNSYDKMMSKINEIEKYQQDVAKKHKKMKIRLIGRGAQKASAGGSPYKNKPNYKRGKSAPPMEEVSDV